MKIEENDFEMLEFQENEEKEKRTYYLFPKNQDILEVLNDNFIQIIDEDGSEIAYTHENFEQIFDRSGLGGFIM